MQELKQMVSCLYRGRDRKECTHNQPLINGNHYVSTPVLSQGYALQGCPKSALMHFGARNRISRRNHFSMLSSFKAVRLFCTQPPSVCYMIGHKGVFVVPGSVYQLYEDFLKQEPFLTPVLVCTNQHTVPTTRLFGDYDSSRSYMLADGTPIG